MTLKEQLEILRGEPIQVYEMERNIRYSSVEGVLCNDLALRK